MITVDTTVQARAHVDPALIEEYAQAMGELAEFPPLTVFVEGDGHILADGFHRYAAAKRADLSTFLCELREGGLREAVLFAVGANGTHGRRRSNEDKRCAVRKLLNDAEWCHWSDREIARRCSVSHQLVAEVRSQITGLATGDERFFRNKHGSIGKMKIEKLKQNSTRTARKTSALSGNETRQSEFGGRGKRFGRDRRPNWRACIGTKDL